eukprot:c3628_g1_i1 orf=2-154(-)
MHLVSQSIICGDTSHNYPPPKAQHFLRNLNCPSFPQQYYPLIFLSIQPPVC